MYVRVKRNTQISLDQIERKADRAILDKLIESGRPVHIFDILQHCRTVRSTWFRERDIAYKVIKLQQQGYVDIIPSV